MRASCSQSIRPFYWTFLETCGGRTRVLSATRAAGRARHCYSRSLRPEIEPHPLVDELQGVGASIVGALVDHADRDHLVEKILPSRVGHRADPELERIAGIDDSMLFHRLDRKRDLIVVDVRIVLLDERVRPGIVAVEIVIPADRGGVDEALHEIGSLLDDLGAG